MLKKMKLTFKKMKILPKHFPKNIQDFSDDREKNRTR